ncbi:MAG TPA: TIGR00730 family Rossman fold protein, partial [Pseudomonadales bacterium]
MRRICVFAGSSTGSDEMHRRTAIALGEALAERDIELVYGGGCVGLMGVLADAALARRGRVIGVIPETLMEREVGHHRLTQLKVVDSMHERKATMAALSDGFIALPGGFGTLEELFEVLTWAQLGLHAHPCGLLNVGGYYDALLAFLDHARSSAFVRAEHAAMLLVDDDPRRLLDRFATYRAPVVQKWLQRGNQT